MVSCAACGCSRTSKNIEKGITFHRFPKDAAKKKAWMKALNKNASDLTTNSCLCSEHFAPECFDRSSKLKLRLLPSALPTIEVSRLKNVRTYTTPTKIEIPEELLATSIKSHDIEAPGTSTMNPNLEDKRKLKRTISELKGQSLMKTHKIKRLQKQVWYKKRQMHSLKAMVVHLKNRNLILEDQHNRFFNQFGENKNVIQR